MEKMTHTTILNAAWDREMDTALRKVTTINCPKLQATNPSEL